mgnify:CR=1 FL=1
MICVGVNADQHDYEPLEKGVYQGSRSHLQEVR